MTIMPLNHDSKIFTKFDRIYCLVFFLFFYSFRTNLLPVVFYRAFFEANIFKAKTDLYQVCDNVFKYSTDLTSGFLLVKMNPKEEN
ncbi:hypothetical protein BpHYR1_014350 [Brachionus plicatilis]|uniref:Uncharacterized protein n=1 Tax=Brachionus plicatilis TaxID=10195 RepID=A0A3M7SUU5_BRAPC|nr:hypothetical protein BpHYR1_014350 [Brachionus plicatilis]